MSKSRQIKTSRRLRRLALAALLVPASGCASGDASLASLNPFATAASQAGGSPGGIAAEGGITSGVSGLVQGTRNQASSVGMTLKSAYGKGRATLASALGSTTTTTASDGSTEVAKSDPLLLQNKPASIGPEVFVANGQLWESTGNYERAMENYSKALESHPENAPALASIARLHYRQQRHEQAVDYFRRAIKTEPSEAGLYNDLGLTLSKLERHDEAIEAIGQALAVAPGTARYANNLATVQFAAGQEQQARTTLMKHNKPAVAHYNMAYLYYNSQRTDQALAELGKVLAMGPQAEGDTASQRAFEKSKELFDKLGGPATQIAQALPQLYGAAQAAGSVGQKQTAVAASVRDTPTGVTVRLSGGESASPPQQAATTAPATAKPATTPPAEAEAETEAKEAPAAENAGAEKAAQESAAAEDAPEDKAAGDKAGADTAPAEETKPAPAAEADTETAAEPAPAPAGGKASATSNSGFQVPPSLANPSSQPASGN